MNKFKALTFRVLLFLSITLIIAGCTTENTEQQEEPNDNEPLEENNDPENIDMDEEPEDLVLTFLYELGVDEFNRVFKEPVEDEFPHITLEFVDSTDLDEAFAEGLQPDLYFISEPYIFIIQMG